MTEIELKQQLRLHNAIIRVANAYVSQTSNINWEQRFFETAKDFAISLFSSQWYDGQEELAINQALNFAKKFIERAKDFEANEIDI